mgnify:CR=1 FL=1
MLGLLNKYRYHIKSVKESKQLYQLSLLKFCLDFGIDKESMKVPQCPWVRVMILSEHKLMLAIVKHAHKDRVNKKIGKNLC